jgi:hypothetical protein
MRYATLTHPAVHAGLSGRVPELSARRMEMPGGLGAWADPRRRICCRAQGRCPHSFLGLPESLFFSEEKKQKTFMSSAASAWLAVWLAVAVLLGAGGRAEADPAASALAAATIFCHGGADQGQHHAPVHRHVADPAIVQASLAALHTLAVPESAPCLPTPSVGCALRAWPVQGRAPPGYDLRAFFARGPPIPV